MVLDTQDYLRVAQPLLLSVTRDLESDSAQPG